MRLDRVTARQFGRAIQRGDLEATNPECGRAAIRAQGFHARSWSRYAAWAVLAAYSALPAAATAGPFGAGVIAGEPTGISLKLQMNRANAIDGAVAWSLEGNNEFTVLGDYLFHNDTLFTPSSGSLPLYFGIGGRIRFREEHDDEFGVRFPIGITYLFEEAPFDTFFEVVPILDLNPSTEFDINVAIGGRFYF